LAEQFGYLIKICILKKYIQKTAIALCALLCCTACFDLQENLFLKKDGSGTFSFVIDMSQFKSMMAMFDDVGKSLDSKDKKNERKNKTETKKSPSDKLNSTFEKTRRKLLNTAGISNVKTIEDSSSLNFGISFDFKNIAALNEAMNKLFDDDDSSGTETKKVTYFEYKDNQLSRLEALDSKSILGKSSSMSEKGPQTNSENPLYGMEQLFGTVSYTMNYEFENKVSSVKNENSLLSANMQKVTLKIFPFAAAKDSVKSKSSIANTISFK